MMTPLYCSVHEADMSAAEQALKNKDGGPGAKVAYVYF